MGTLFSIFIALFIIFSPMRPDLNANTPLLATTLIVIALFFLFLVPIRYMFVWGPLQKAEKDSTPRILDLFKKDWHLFLSNAWLILFSLFSLLLAFTLISSHPMFNLTWLFSFWIILLGLTIDSSLRFTHRILNYLNPFSVIKLFGHEAEESIQNEKELDLCHWIDGLSEISLKGLEQNSTSLSNLALSQLQETARLFFESSKSISHHNQDKQTRLLGISDKVSFVAFYLYQRIEMIFEKALKNMFEPTCSYIITQFGKIALDAAKYDISMASPPLRFIGKLSARAQTAEMEETAIKASCILLEVAKAYINEIDLTYLEIKDPYLSIINGMEKLAKGEFKANKNSNIPILIQPFKELKELFQTEKMQTHADTPVILQNINRVLGEFEALQMVMNTIPPIPTSSS
jgi:hypothetical protein